jgi:cytoskeletal protein RodZ
MATVHTADTDGYSSHPDVRRSGSSLGGLLKRARERRGLTLQQVAKETKLPQRHLEALEQDNLALLPGFYQRAEIRAYAQAVGIDPSVLRAQLDSALKPPDARGAAREVPNTSQPRPQRVYAAVALALITLAVFGYSITRRAPTSTPATVQPGQPEAIASTPAPSEGTPPVSVAPTRADALSGGADAVKASDVSVGSSTETAEPRVPVEELRAQGEEPQPPARSITELVVTTDPAGARVTVNGIAWGVSPLTIQHLPPGDKRIRVTKEGFAAQERVLRLDQGQQKALDIPLETAP